MKFIWHIIKKDIRRDRWALLVWGLLFVAQTGSGWAMLHWEEFDLTKMRYVQTAMAVLVFLQVVMGYILVTRLVHADAVFGTNMFWLTRPVSGARMLFAKALGALLLFGLLPLLLLLPWWLYCGFGWREIGWELVETFGWQLLMIAPAFLVATLTDDLGRVLLWTLLLLVGLLSWIALLQASLMAALGKAFPSGGADGVYTKLCVVGLMLIAGSAAVAAHQYVTRRFVRSVVLAAAGLGLIALVGHVFRWNWAPAIRQLAEPALPAAPAEMADRVTFEILPALDITAPIAKEKAGPAALDTWLDLQLRVQGLPDGILLGTDKLAQTWTWPTGIRITRGGNFYGGLDFDFPELRRQYALPVPAEDPETAEWVKVKRAELDARLKAKGLPAHRRRTSAEAHQGWMLGTQVTLPNSFVSKMRHEPATYTASFLGILYHMKVIAELPLTVGAHASGGSLTFRLRQMREGKPLVLVTEPALARSGLWNSGGYGWRQEGSDWRTVAQSTAVNFVTGDIGWVGNNQAGSQNLLVAGVMLNWNIMQLGSRMVIRAGKNVGLSGIDPQWRDHTRLVFLSPVTVGAFTREVKTEKFTVFDADRGNADAAIDSVKKP